jgi:heme exporter protein D
MSYQNYVIAAYCVFAVVMLWDFIAPRLQMRQQLRAARLLATRAGWNTTNEFPLSRE